MKKLTVIVLCATSCAGQRAASHTPADTPDPPPRSAEELQRIAEHSPIVYMAHTIVGSLPGRIFPDGLLITYDTRVECPVHNAGLVEEEVPIVYGFVVLDDKEAAAERALFPYAHESVYAGCRRSSDSPGRARVKACSGCRRAKREWMVAASRGRAP